MFMVRYTYTWILVWKSCGDVIMVLSTYNLIVFLNKVKNTWNIPMEILVFGITVYPLVFQHPPNTLWRSVFGPPKGLTSGGICGSLDTYTQKVFGQLGITMWSPWYFWYTLEDWQIEPTAITHLSRKENDLNQTSREFWKPAINLPP